MRRLSSALALALTLGGCAGVERTTRVPPQEKAPPEAAPEVERVLEGLAAVEEKLAGGDAAGAVTAYEKALSGDLTHADEAVVYAALLREAGNPAKARAVLTEVLGEKPESPELLFALASLAASEGKDEEQVALLRRAARADPGLADAAAALGEIALRQGASEEAVGLFEQALESDPRHVVALTGMGKIRHSAGSFREAEGLFSLVIDAEPRLASGYLDRSRTRRRLGNLEGALADLSQAVELEPDYYWGRIDRGRLLLLLGRDDEALADFRVAARIEPGNFVSYVYLAGVHFGRKRWEEAGAAFERVRELRPDYQQTYPALGEIHYRGERWYEAAEAFITGFEHAPAELHLLLLAAVALKRGGDEQVAREFLRDNLPHVPPSGWLRTTAEYLIRPDYDLPMLAGIRGETNEIARRRMLFYLGSQFALLGRPRAAFTYFLEAAELEREDLLEKRLADWEVERMEAR